MSFVQNCAPLNYFSDVHIGAVRSGGTTPQSAYQLRVATLDSFRTLLALCDGASTLLNGDIFDSQTVPMWDLWEAASITDEWLKRNAQSSLFVSKGNHDYNKNSTVFSSFDLYSRILQAAHPVRFVPITEPTHLEDHGMWVLPHAPNQDIHDLWLKTLPPCKRVALHANFDNRFAVEADHSLNVTPQQAEAVLADHLIFGHEHQRKTALAGKVIVVGNANPTSVSDCLGNSEKYILRILPDKLEFLSVWEAAKDFARPDWRSLSDIPPAARFIRVEGEATSAESSQVVAAISRLRSQSQALVITNAVSIDGMINDDEMRMSLSSLKSFDVYSELCKLLDADEVALVTNLMKENNVSAQAAE